jgi:hypothetical protein
VLTSRARALPTQPFRDDASLHYYAALCALFLAQRSPPPASKAKQTPLRGRTLGRPDLHEAWRDDADASRLAEARTYLERAVELVGGLPSKPGQLAAELEAAGGPDVRARNMHRRQRIRKPKKLKEADLEPPFRDPYLRIAVLDLWRLVRPLGRSCSSG